MAGAGIRADRTDLPDPRRLRPPQELVEQILLAVERPDVRAERAQPHAYAPYAGAQREHGLAPNVGAGEPSVGSGLQAHPQVEIGGVPGVLDLAPGGVVAHSPKAIWAGTGPTTTNLRSQSALGCVA